MNIQKVELLTTDLQAQRDYYNRILELPTQLTSSGLHIQAGETEILFLQAPPRFEGAYHFAFNIPENQFHASKTWTARRISLLRDEVGTDEFASENWNSHSIYFKDAAGNVLEFIARHNLQNAMDGDFNSRQILQVSEIGLPSEDVVGLANELCTRLNISVFKQEPSETFTPVGDDKGLLILPIRNRIWIPNSGVPAKLNPVGVVGEANGKRWEVRGVPYEITN